MGRAGKVIEHKTYVAAVCTRCHDAALRICVAHDECTPTNHDEKACDDAYWKVRANISAAFSALYAINAVENAADVQRSIMNLRVAHERIEDRE
jgi:hypothetical protein